ncbi:MAG: lipoprotein signal peptidase [Muribaculaceae bacterium]|nr:lipoprotein signal peptidase [Muribaculaceae bacterium]
MKLSKGVLATLVIFAVILLDQLLKIWIKTGFYLGEDLQITSFFHLYFIQNPGMAFGMEMGSKLFLSIFRILAVIFLVYYIVMLRKNEHIPSGYVVCVALITAGAMGNIVDCAFYGMIFNNPMPPEVATLFPESGGYAPFLHGQVVDMLYFPLLSFDWPSWMPWIGGRHFIFFQPVFNLADAAISVGIIVVILFYSRYLGDPRKIGAAGGSVEE